MTEWRSRYKGYGVMVYWHVETNAVCLYSQLKSFSSSEIAAMIEGLVRHDTEMRVEKNFVDSHGQSRGGLCILPSARHGPVHAASEARSSMSGSIFPSPGTAEDYPNLAGTIARPSAWI